MPECWFPYLAVGRPISLEDLAKGEAEKQKIRRRYGASSEETGYLTVRVLPMGWLSAVGVMQAIHRGLMLRAPPLWGGPKARGRDPEDLCPAHKQVTEVRGRLARILR